MNALPTRILIVEDNADDEILLLRQLKQSHLHQQVRVISDGGVALDYLTDAQSESEGLIAVFLDLNLPTVTGLQLLEGIRANERTRHLPVILMATSNTPDDLNRCRELGVSAFVNKPISFTAFTKAVADTFHSSTGSKVTARLMRDSQHLLLLPTPLGKPKLNGGLN